MLSILVLACQRRIKFFCHRSSPLVLSNDVDATTCVIVQSVLRVFQTRGLVSLDKDNKKSLHITTFDTPRSVFEKTNSFFTVFLGLIFFFWQLILSPDLTHFLLIPINSPSYINKNLYCVANQVQCGIPREKVAAWKVKE